MYHITGVALFYTTLSSEFVMLFRFLLLFEPFLMIGKHLHRVVIGTSEFRETFRIDAALVLDENIVPLLINPQAACMWSPRMALCRGVSPSVSCAFTSAPASNRSFTIANEDLCAAVERRRHVSACASRVRINTFLFEQRLHVVDTIFLPPSRRDVNGLISLFCLLRDVRSVFQQRVQNRDAPSGAA